MRLRILIVGLQRSCSPASARSFGLRHGDRPDPGTPRRRAAAAGQPPPTSSLRASPARSSDLSAVPGDWTAWAALGFAYTRAGPGHRRPAYYPKAEAALRTLTQAAASRQPGRAGRARRARQRPPRLRHRPGSGPPRASHADPYSADAYGVLADAQTQLGHPAAATDAVQHMLDLRPGLAAYARASYDLEQQRSPGRRGGPHAPCARRRGRPQRTSRSAATSSASSPGSAGRLGDAETEYTGRARRRPRLSPAARAATPGSPRPADDTADGASRLRRTHGALSDARVPHRVRRRCSAPPASRRAPTSNSRSPRRR